MSYENTPSIANSAAIKNFDALFNSLLEGVGELGGKLATAGVQTCASVASGVAHAAGAVVARAEDLAPSDSAAPKETTKLGRNAHHFNKGDELKNPGREEELGHLVASASLPNLQAMQSQGAFLG